MADTLVSASRVTKDFNTGKIVVHALRGVDLEVSEGDFMSIVGPSGSGKTTLLNLIGALDVATGGELSVFGKDLSTLSRRKRAELRLHSLGFVFQAYNLVPVLTARENVEFVLELQGAGSERVETASEVLESLSLGELMDRRPQEMSGGQQQRVAVARAVASRPRLVLADEPTGNLDPVLSREIMQIFIDFNQVGVTVMVASHDLRLIEELQKPVVTLNQGRIIHNDLEVADV